MIATRGNWTMPIERLYALQRELDRGPGNSESMEGSAFIPPMDVIETSDEVLCHLEVPGINRDDLEIRVEANIVVISGEKKHQQPSNAKEGGFHSIERRYGRFERSFALPRSVNASNIRARYDNGILTIVLPKVEESKPRRVEIEDGNNGRQLS